MKNLPICSYEEEIVHAVNNNNVVVITADTGSGKSTQVPQMLERAGYNVVVTQPRRIAARNVAKRVAAEMVCDIGDKVGYMTAYEHECSKETKILYCTDGLQLVREILGNNKEEKKVLIIDEVHEWNLNIETLVAYTKFMLDSGADIKVVIMSATMEAEELAKFYNTTAIIKVPGSLYEIKERYTTGSVISDIKRLVDEGKNVLVFQPGKREIEETIASLDFLQGEAVILPLHGEMEISEQNKCFANYSLPKVIVSTNVAQTSITIPDIDAVVDTATEKRIEVINSIESLVSANISLADVTQRKGRAGRVKEGIYVYASSYPMSQLQPYTVPEIKRLRLDNIVLRLASIGIDAESLRFFHQPKLESIKESKKLLKNLGAMDSNAMVTKIGQVMAKLPTSVRSSRMLVEAKNQGVLLDVIDCVSVFEAGGIKSKDYIGIGNSEFYLQLTLFQKMNNKIKELKDSGRDTQDLSERERYNLFSGVNAKNYYKALENRRKIKQTISKMWGFESITTTSDRKAINRSCISGLIDNIALNICADVFKIIATNESGFKLDRRACLSNAEFVVGIPKIINFQDRYGITRSMNIISWPVGLIDSDLENYFQTEHSYEYDKYSSKVYDIAYTNVYAERYITSRIEVPYEEIAEKFEVTEGYEYNQDTDWLYKVHRVKFDVGEYVVSKEEIEENDDFDTFREVLSDFMADVVLGRKTFSYAYECPYFKKAVSSCDTSKGKEALKRHFKEQMEAFDVRSIDEIDKTVWEYFVC